ncbi:hypothetical protein GCM10027610_019830 [Dactylosporangium cerinum]
MRAALRTRLPDYMVPSGIVVLPELPLTPNGKLDRRALPAPVIRRDAATELVEPRTPTERLIADVWRDLLTVETLGIDDDFFDLGGHSLIATQVVARLRTATAGGVSVLDVFQHRTVRALAALLDTPAGARGPRRLLNELTRPVPAAQRVASLVCVPYGGGSAVVYQPLADALPAGWSLHAVAIPGQDIGLKEDALPFDELAARCTAEVLERVEGPLIVYGHCGVGSSLAVELARRLEAAGRTVDAVYIGAVFPFARPTGRVTGLLSRIAGREALLGNRVYENWLRSMGVDMAEFDRAEADTIIRNMREHTRLAEEYFTGLFADVAAGRITPLRAPIVSVIGSQDTQTEFYAERYREWHFLTGTTALVVLDEAGHFFLKYRATELAGVVTAVHDTGEPLRDPDGGWAVAGRSTSRTASVATGPEPSLGRFLAVAAGQLVSIVGSALTEFAIPLWIYLQTGSLVRFAVFAVLGLVPGMLVAPIAGAVVDRYDRRTVMLVGDVAAGASQAVLLALALTGSLRVGHIYVLLVTLSVALTFQRLAFASAVPQLVPKRYLGHANGIVQLSFGAGQFLVPLAAAGLMATVGLRGVLLLDVASYVCAIAVVVVVRFPRTLAWARRETFWQEVVGGWRYPRRGRPAAGAHLLRRAQPVHDAAVPAAVAAGAVLRRPRRGGPGQHGRRPRRDPRRPADELLGRSAPAAGPRHAAGRAAAGGVQRAARAADQRAARRGGRAGHVVRPDPHQRHLHHDCPGEGAATVPRPGVRGEHRHRVLHHPHRLRGRRPARQPPAGAADGSRRGPGGHARRRHRHRPRPRDGAAVPRPGGGDGGAGLRVAAAAEPGRVRRPCPRRRPRRPHRRPGARREGPRPRRERERQGVRR